MPIRIPNGLPARETIISENIFVMEETRSCTQDIRPLEIAILNLMPTKIATETQLLRLLGNTPLQVNATLLRVTSHEAKNVSLEHLISFYKTFDEVKDRNFDGMIITGAPVEHLEFEEVEYWDELCQIMEWSKTHVYSTFHICWGAQAALYYHYGIPKYKMDKKLFGVFKHHLVKHHPILCRGFNDEFLVPHSRHTTIHKEDVLKHPEIKILAESDEAGIYAMQTNGGRQIFITGHSEYDAHTLELEYKRDKDAGLPIEVPVNYYPNDDDTLDPPNTWRAHANLIYSNWLNYFVYQETPYDITTIK